MSSPVGMTPGGLVPCVGGAGFPASGQIKVTTGQTFNVTFAGTPPFNVSHTVVRNTGSQNYQQWCGGAFLNSSLYAPTRITTNTFTFTVQPFNYTNPNDTYTSPNNGTTDWVMIQVPGDSIMFAATELDIDPKYTNNFYPYYVSANYTIVNSTSSGANTRARPSSIHTKFALASGVLLGATIILSL